MSDKMSLFISDCHMGAGRPWDWFSDAEGKRLIDFCNYVIYRYLNQGDVKDIVLLGDIFDLWVCPHDEMPHTFAEIVKYQVPVLAAIQKMASIVPTHYVNGNHDFRITAKDIRIAFNGEVKYSGQEYRRNNVLAVHGHRQAMFNRPDSQNGGPFNLPVGYYITRLYTSLVRGKVAIPNLVAQVINESVQAMTIDSLTEAVLDALKNAIRDSLRKEVTYFEMGGICEDQTYETVRYQYKDLFSDWVEQVGMWKSIRMILCEMDRLGATADQLCKDGINIIVMGHSHGTKMDKDSLGSLNRIYANCGYWCGMNKRGSKNNDAHYVQTNGKQVELCSYIAGKSTVKKSKTL